MAKETIYFSDSYLPLQVQETHWCNALDSGPRGLDLRPGQVTVLCSWAKHLLLQYLSPPWSINEYPGTEGSLMTYWGGGGINLQ